MRASLIWLAPLLAAAGPENSLEFSGDDYIAYTEPNGSLTIDADSYYVLAWVKSTDVVAQETIYSKTDGSVRKLVLSRRAATINVEVQGFGSSGNRAQGDGTTGVLVENEWVMLTVGIDSAAPSAERARIYQGLSRDLKSLAASDDPLQADNGDVRIGDGALPGFVPFKGKIYVIVVFDGAPDLQELREAYRLGFRYDYANMTNVYDVVYPTKTKSETRSRVFTVVGDPAVSADVPGGAISLGLPFETKGVHVDGSIVYDRDITPWCLQDWPECQDGLDTNVVASGWGGDYHQDWSLYLPTGGERWFSWSQGTTHGTKGYHRHAMVKLAAGDAWPQGVPPGEIIQIDRSQYVDPTDNSLNALAANEDLSVVHPSIFATGAGTLCRAHTQVLFVDDTATEHVVVLSSSADAGETWTVEGTIDWGEVRTVNGIGGLAHTSGAVLIPLYKVDSTGGTTYSSGLWSVASDCTPSGSGPAATIAAGVAGVSEPSETHVITLDDGTHIALVREDRSLTGNDNGTSLVVKTAGTDPTVWGTPFAGPAGNAYPFMIQATDGTLVALARGKQPSGAGREGHPSIVFSTDRGLTWSLPRYIGDVDGGLFMGGVLEETSPNVLRATWSQDPYPGNDNQTAEFNNIFSAEVSHQVWH